MLAQGTTGPMQSARNISSCQGASRADALSLARISVMLLSASFASASVPASAQVAGPALQAATALPDAIKQREQELEATRAQQRARPSFSSNSRPRSRRSARTGASSTHSSSTSQRRFEPSKPESARRKLGFVRLTPAKSKSEARSIRAARSRGSTGSVAARRTANAASPAGQARRRIAIASNRNIARLRRARVACPRRSPRQGPR